MNEDTSGQIDYIARQLQEQTQLLRELLELEKYTYEHPKPPRPYGLWNGADWIETGNDEVYASPFPQLMTIWAQDHIGFEVREIGMDGLPVPIEEAG